MEILCPHLRLPPAPRYPGFPPFAKLTGFMTKNRKSHRPALKNLVLCRPRQYPWDKAPQKVTVPQRPVLHKDSARTGKASGAHGERREIS